MIDLPRSMFVIGCASFLFSKLFRRERYCRDCFFYHPEKVGGYMRNDESCQRPREPVMDIVTGEPRPNGSYGAAYERLDYSNDGQDKCGPGARYFKDKSHA